MAQGSSSVGREQIGAGTGAEGVCHDIFHVEGTVGNILSWLPPVSLAKARSVCSLWNRIIITQKSRNTTLCCILSCPLKKMKQLTPGGSWQWERDIIHDGRAYDHSTDSWMTIPLPKSAFNSCMSLFPKAANVGLVALRDRVPFQPLVHFWVGNPMTNSWRQIAGASDPDQGPGFDNTYELIVHEESKSYKIVHFFYSKTRPVLRTHIYNSRTEEWSQGATFPRQGPIYIGSSAVRKGSIYFLQERAIPDSIPYQMKLCVVRYDVERDEFSVMVSSGPYTIYQIMPFRLIFNPSDDSEEQIPSIVAQIYDSDQNEVRKVGLLRFKAAHQRWVWDENWEVDAIEWFPNRYSGSNFSMTGEARYLYTICRQSYNKVTFINAETLECRLLPDPCDTKRFDVHELKGSWHSATMCSFIPRFDMKP
ncbi:hypothetical protein MPTK1_5g19480 [Marchantia polymorpha subsp. ruderalis]|uniref:F-box domain-containing protein n=2 Tax=Marchantia polymorpha TaxID=3197 RepID=A0AAF6BK32_MARPO|nr:hypothetical protein MARPO_0134s0006 [Marchantia polymorpha]BBN12366.1 hypothetical protein Mp_5g19480 [Marchantia polymorpha subsp. ruderalis]|eukprot:PTQ29789.1 hypothetical protein MARPO_0134s0006 [Marchantia polymorpha]